MLSLRADFSDSEFFESIRSKVSDAKKLSRKPASAKTSSTEEESHSPTHAIASPAIATVISQHISSSQTATAPPTSAPQINTSALQITPVQQLAYGPYVPEPLSQYAFNQRPDQAYQMPGYYQAASQVQVAQTPEYYQLQVPQQRIETSCINFIQQK